MNKFPLLEQLRAKYRRQDDEIADPLRAVIDGLQRHIAQLSASLRALEKLVGSEIGKRAFEQIGYEIGDALQKHIAEAMPAAYQSGGKSFTLTLPVDMLRFMDPKSMESEILKRYTYETAPSLRVRADRKAQDGGAYVTVIDIRIPEMGYRRAMTELNYA